MAQLKIGAVVPPGFLFLVATLIAAPVHGQDESGSARSFTRWLEVGAAAFRVAVADADDERRRGLSDVPTMGSSEGLYFVYPAPRLLSFWMKDMRFAIDILWIDKHHRIVHIAENVVPETFPTIFSGPQPAQYALEINAGRAREAGIAIGDRVLLR